MSSCAYEKNKNERRRRLTFHTLYSKADWIIIIHHNVAIVYNVIKNVDCLWTIRILLL